MYDEINGRSRRSWWTEDGVLMLKEAKLKVKIKSLLAKGSEADTQAIASGINTVGNILKEENRLSGSIGVYTMPEDTAIEIDEVNDWIIAESLMKKQLQKIF